jgi:hypothetical protein
MKTGKLPPKIIPLYNCYISLRYCPVKSASPPERRMSDGNEALQFHSETMRAHIAQPTLTLPDTIFRASSLGC